MADAPVTRDFPYRYIGPNRPGQPPAFVVGLAQALGVAATSTAVHGAVLGLGAPFQRHIGADVAGTDPSQVVTVTPTARFDHVRAVRDRALQWRCAALRWNIGLGVAAAANALVVHLAESTRVVISRARFDRATSLTHRSPSRGRTSVRCHASRSVVSDGGNGLGRCGSSRSVALAYWSCRAGSRTGGLSRRCTATRLGACRGRRSRPFRNVGRPGTCCAGAGGHHP